MISSSEVGGCCRVQVARLPSDRPPTAPEDTTPPLPPWLPPAFSPFNFLLQPPKISDPTTDAAPRISREGVRACKVVLPSNQLLFRNVGRQGAGNFGFEKFSPRTGAPPPPPRRPFLDEKYITERGSRYAKHYLNYRTIPAMRVLRACVEGERNRGCVSLNFYFFGNESIGLYFLDWKIKSLKLYFVISTINYLLIL